MMEYKVIRQKRKSITMRLIEMELVEVKAPLNVPMNVIEDFIEKNSLWIQGQQIYLQGMIYFETGAKILISGESKTIEIKKAYQNKVILGENNLKVYSKDLEHDYVLNLFFEWMREWTRREIEASLVHYGQFINKPYRDIRIKNQKTRWGSCSSKANLNFNLRCGMMPPFVRDYIVVHELCHLIHMNHSADFWNLVAEVYGNYKRALQWLKDNSYQLDIR